MDEMKLAVGVVHPSEVEAVEPAFTNDNSVYGAQTKPPYPGGAGARDDQGGSHTEDIRGGEGAG